MEYIIFKREVFLFLQERKKIHDNDPAIYSFWNKFADFMSNNEENTILFFKECDEDTADWMSEIFEDISERLRSNRFIKSIELLDKKYPKLNLTSFVESAKNYL